MVSSLQNRLAKIRATLDRLRERDALEAGLDDANDQGYREVPPLDEVSVLKLERRLRGPLPPEYRAFLKSVHAGGPGPGYGFVSPLEYAKGALWPPPWGRSVRMLMSKRFGIPTRKLADAVPVIDWGCGEYEVVVSTGSDTGRMAFVGSDSISYSRAEGHAADERVGFLGFYEAWLTAAMRRARTREPVPARSSYVLELTSDISYEVHAFPELSRLERCLDDFCRRTRVVSYSPPVDGGNVGIWVVQRGRIVQYVDLRPFLAMSYEDEAVPCDQPRAVARLRKKSSSPMPAPGVFTLNRTRPLEPLPSLLKPILARGEVLHLKSRRLRGQRLPSVLRWGAFRR